MSVIGFSKSVTEAASSTEFPRVISGFFDHQPQNIK